MADDQDTQNAELVALADLESADVNSLLSNVDSSDRYGLTTPLGEAADVAEKSGELRKARALRFLHDLLNIHLRVEDRGEPFGPMFQSGNGRTCTASDFRGEQNGIIAEFAPLLEHPVLRARLADIAWYNDRTRGESGRLAVKSYCKIIDRRISGDLHRTHGTDDHILDMADYLQRAMQIAARVYKRDRFPKFISASLRSLFDRSVESGEYVAFVKVAEIGLAFDITEWPTVVAASERITALSEGADYPMAIQSVWELAARGYGVIGNSSDQKRCQTQAVLQDLRMRDEVSQASAKAHWVRTAIYKLRQFGGHKDWVADLRKDLRELEEQSLDDFVPVPYQIDVTESATGTIEVFEKLSLPDILLQFALLNRPQSKEELEKFVEESSEKYVMS